jgi:GTP cyclohydrolase I
MTEEEKRVRKDMERVLRHIEPLTADRPGLKDTPKRVVKSWKELYAGYHQKIEDIMTVFDADGYDQMVVLTDIELFSMCEHHMLPFYGVAHVAYIPEDKIVGISKLSRLVNIYSRRLQNQERITKQVTDALDDYLNPRGSACVIEASHLCMRMRGASESNATMVTSSVTGVFREKIEVRNEFMQHIKE